MACLLTLAGLSLVPRITLAQDAEWDASRVHASRPALEQLQGRLEAAAESPAYSPVLRAEARERAERIRERLAAGDFRVGDRIALTVEREVALTDTFTVAEGAEVILPTLGAVSLRGVLHAEAEQHLRTEIARFVREPVVRVQTFVRVAVTGAVAQTGFYVVLTQQPLTEVLTAAGGVSPQAQLSDLTVRRDNETVIDGETIQRAIAEGRTVDQLGIRSGDQIVVGSLGGLVGLGGAYQGLRTLTLLLALPFSIIGLASLF
jgi:protein involved in polysaccharide export with SLBB domain